MITWNAKIVRVYDLRFLMEFSWGNYKNLKNENTRRMRLFDEDYEGDSADSEEDLDELDDEDLERRI